MAEQSVIHSTFVIERNYAQSPERVWAAFADPEKKRRWFVEGDGKGVDEFAMDFRAGGSERVRYHYTDGVRFPGVVFTNEGTYQDIVPNRRVVFASTMAMGERKFSASLVTVELAPKGAGTDLICTHQGAFFEGSDGPQIREAGWRKLLERCAEELAR
jgi:uncharacterized protein YndB with AHSA1/START domain